MTNRRDFMKSASLAGAGLYTATTWNLVAQPAVGEQIENEFLIARFDPLTGYIQIDRKNGAPLLRNSVVRAHCGGTVRATSDQDYARSAKVSSIRDALGHGRQISAQCLDRRKQLDFEILLTLYDGRNALVVEAICRNSSAKETRMVCIEPIRAVLEEGGECVWADAEKALTNGFMYPDPGRVEELGQSNLHAVSSMWNMCFYRGAGEEGLVVGYLDNSTATGRISAMYDRTLALFHSHGGMSFTAESLFGGGCVLRPGAGISSGKVIFNIAPDTFTALETYAQAVADVHSVRLNPVINGWCSWFYTHEYINEEEILRNAEFAARALKPYGLEYIQVDAGWFRTYGDWEGNERFPHGMKWLSEKIRERGLRAGLWFAPYCIAEGTEIFDHHPDWLIADAEGKPWQCGGGLSTPQAGPYGIPSLMKKVYGLDITHPGAAGWLHKLFKGVADDWNYDFIKLDFVEWSILSADRYHDPTLSKAATYRKGMSIIRDALGPTRHILDCGPMNTTVGIVDSARIELDLPHLTWEQYTANFNSSGPAMAKRYYFNRKTWTNDADHLGLALLALPQARAAATIIALSGGTLISGDRLIDLDSDRLEILRKVIPSYGVAARPVDLFENDKPEIFELPVRTDFAQWMLVAVFNYGDAPVDKRVSLGRLRLPKSDRYVVFEFWSQTFLGEPDRELKVRVEPQSVCLLSIHPQTEAPRAIATDRHFTQGALELRKVSWDQRTNTLTGISSGPAGTSHNVTIYVPRAYRWSSEHPEYFHESGHYSIKQTEPSIVRVHLRFDSDAEVAWQAEFVAT
ncbi:MAG TPA: glycoside hydrolase family 36 protein [Candidatus Acidoferrum sp.]|nr:glycoside hydrolase family 36 protein [Candidatus Acidoferrum sp.]